MDSGKGPPTATLGATIALVGALGAIYMVSQFLRNSVGVIAPNLARDLALSPSDLGLLSSAFFVAFAAAQLPLGVAIDRWGPRTVMLACAGVVIAGAVLFAAAQTPAVMVAARVLLGLGSSCYLMAPLALFARRFPPQRFAMLASLQIGIGSIGTLAATAPLALSAAVLGWRNSFLVVAGVMLAMAVLVAVVVRADGRDKGPSAHRESLAEAFAGIAAAVRTPQFRPLFAMHLTAHSSFALIIGLWGGPYLTHIYGFGLTARGDILFVAAVTQIIGTLSFGPMERLFGRHKPPVLGGALLTAAAFAVLAVAGRLGPVAIVVWMGAFGLVSAYTVVLISHGKSLFAPHLVGRGMTVLNMGTMGGVFVSQLVSGAVIDLFPSPGGVYALDGYRAVFALQAVLLALACAAYARVREPRGEA